MVMRIGLEFDLAMAEEKVYAERDWKRCIKSERKQVRKHLKNLQQDLKVADKNIAAAEEHVAKLKAEMTIHYVG